MKFKIEKLTVLMTTYNCADFIRSAIKSVLNQIHSNFEFLIIDDGSEDGSSKIVSEFKDERINFISIEHSGRSRALNYGLKRAKYDWIALIDSDDIWHTLKLEKQIQEIKSPKDLIFTNIVYFINKKPVYFSDKIENDRQLFNKLLIHGHIAPSSVLFNRNEILKYSGFDESLPNSEDYDLWLRLILDFKFKCVNEYLTYLKIRNDSLSRTNIKLTNTVIHKIQEKHFPQILEQLSKDKNLNINEIKGWSEFFYGDKKLARKELRKLGVKLIINPKIIIAYILSFLHEKYLTKILELRIRYRVKFFLNKLLLKSDYIQREFENSIL